MFDNVFHIFVDTCEKKLLLYFQPAGWFENIIWLYTILIILVFELDIIALIVHTVCSVRPQGQKAPLPLPQEGVGLMWSQPAWAFSQHYGRHLQSLLGSNPSAHSGWPVGQRSQESGGTVSRPHGSAISSTIQVASLHPPWVLPPQNPLSSSRKAWSATKEKESDNRPPSSTSRRDYACASVKAEAKARQRASLEFSRRKKRSATAAGFEPTHEFRNGFQVHRLNHSARQPKG